MTELNIISKLSKAMTDVKGITKDGKNNYQHYGYQSEAAIKYAVKIAIQQQGLVIIPKYEIINQYDRKSTKGNVNHFVDVLGTYVITDGRESYVGTMVGCGQDTGEKAMAKACTSAQKYFYKQLFNITDKDEDPDGDDSGNYQSKARPLGKHQKQQYADPNAIATFEQLSADLANQKQKDLKEIYKNLFDKAAVNRKSLKTLLPNELSRLNAALDRLAAE